MRFGSAALAAILLVVSLFALTFAGQSECYDDVIVTHTNIDFVDGTYHFSSMINGRPSFARSYQVTPTCGITGRISYSSAGYWFLEVDGSPACSSCEGNGYAFYRAMCGADLATPPTECGWSRTPGYQQSCWEGQYYADMEGGTQCVPEEYPAIVMVKDAANGTVDVGDVLVYTFTVTNTGTLTLTNIVATDQTLGMTISLQLTTLEPGGTTTGTLAHTVRQSDVVDGLFTNTALVVGIAPDLTQVSDPAQETVTVLEAPAISLEKQASEGSFDVGDAILFTFDVTNTGSVTLHDVELYDDTLSQHVPLGTTTLEPGKSTTGTLEYTITQDDVEAAAFTNSASVQATTAGGTSVGDSSSTSVQFTRSPSLNLQKSGEEGIFYEGDQARFSFTLVNTGNVTLENLSLTDFAIGETVSFTVSTLTPGSSTSASIDYSVTASDAAAGLFTNSAVAEAWTLYGERVLAEDQTSIVCAVETEEVELPDDVIIEVHVEDPMTTPSASFTGDRGVRSLAATYCQGEALRVSVSVLGGDGSSIGDVPVFGTLFEVDVLDAGETSNDVSTARGDAVDGVYSLSFDTARLAAGLVDVRVWVPGQETQWRRVALVACGENVDNDLVSDSVDACPSVSGIASNAGCPRGDLDHSGIPDHLECFGGALIEEAYPVRIVVETTSDWTTVSLANGSLLFTSVECEGKPLWACTGMLEMTLTKPCCAPNVVSATYDAFVFDMETLDLEWTIEKGGLGRTAVEIYSYPDPEDPEEHFELIRRFEHTRSTDSDRDISPSTSSQLSAEIVGVIDPVRLDASCARTQVDPLVLALYSAEYGTPEGSRGEWMGWQQGQPNYGAVNSPLGGPYDSLDSETIRHHIDLAKLADIDAFICRWTGVDSTEDQAIGLLLDAAEQAGFRIGINYDARSYDAHNILGRFVDLYGDHPALLREDEMPVIFLPHNQRGPDGWESEFNLLSEAGIDLFAVHGGLHLSQTEKLSGVVLNTFVPVRGETFDLTLVAEKLSRESILSKLRGNVVVACVYPGGIGTYWNQGTFDVPRSDGETYELLWDAAMASNPDWMLIRSFNCWMDGTEIEPSEEYGTTYLDLTRHYAEEWKAAK
ncbi:hypothetical protein ACFLSW_01505 [Candidatus Bipolaricaulota bacterium]